VRFLEDKLSNDELQALFDEFESFKDDPQFHHFGFGYGGQFHEWRFNIVRLIGQYSREGDQQKLQQATDLRDYAFAVLWSNHQELDLKDRQKWKAKAETYKKLFTSRTR
jgi:hypothetical protein